MSKLAVTLILVIILLLWLCFYLAKRILLLRSSKQSLAVKHGKLIEQFLPFLAHYPYNPSQFRFLGTPIDGIQFEEDKIIFIEFKTSKGRLTKNQEKIKEIVDKKRVEFKEFRV